MNYLVGRWYLDIWKVALRSGREKEYKTRPPNCGQPVDDKRAKKVTVGFGQFSQDGSPEPGELKRPVKAVRSGA